MKRLMKGFGALLLALFLGTGLETALAQVKGGGSPLPSPVDVSIRFSRNEGFSRFVFEAADDLFIRAIVVTPARDQIKVRFPVPVRLTTKNIPDVETLLKGNVYLINQSTPFKIKVLQLSSPPRLSLDVIPVSGDEGRRPATKESGLPDMSPGFHVVLDPGHGGYDLGIISGDLREKDITLSIARDLEAVLTRKNRHATLTRKSDQFLSITDRAFAANQKPLDAFISIHLSLSSAFVIFTCFTEPSTTEAQPTELYSLISRQKRFIEKSKALSEGLGKTLGAEFKNDIIYREMNLPLLSSMNAPAVLIELPVNLAYDKPLRTKLVEALVRGLSAYANR
ncbi:MAG TPA: N-acetylmuramoyl-L-alanine amidase [Thermodesulfovibrionales bacterium]|jgi:N-acetylmuramoyl-L-alanine amidase|nr:N-acetylmuramoyl-L-alanine amidase [Thermodesulfovibrionales bacterium]